MFKSLRYMMTVVCMLWGSVVVADEVTVTMHLTASAANDKVMGTIVAKDTKYGLLLTPNLNFLSPGIHGFHIHQTPSCEHAGMGASGHFDPKNTEKHLGPYNDDGHLGDLPALSANKDGKVTLAVLAPRLKVADLKGHALIIHADGDNYSDKPAVGGGGARVACGIVK